MKWLLMALIRVYWLIPLKHRRKCLFKYNCSRFIYDTTQEKGIIAGIRSFRKRYAQCRPGYGSYQTPDGIDWVILKDKSVVRKEELNMDTIYPKYDESFS